MLSKLVEICELNDDYSLELRAWLEVNGFNSVDSNALCFILRIASYYRAYVASLPRSYNNAEIVTDFLLN